MSALFDVNTSANKISLKSLDDKTVPILMSCTPLDLATECGGTLTLKARFKKGRDTVICEGPYDVTADTSFIASLGCPLSSSEVKKIKKSKKPVLFKLSADIDSGTVISYFADKIYIKK